MISLRFLLASVVVAASLVRPAHAETIKIGVTPGPHAQILEAVKPIAARNGLDIQIVEFTDYVVPNAALDAGDLQANSFQNQPYLDNQKADRGYRIETVALTVNFPVGIYSKKYRSWDSLPQAYSANAPWADPKTSSPGLSLVTLLPADSTVPDTSAPSRGDLGLPRPMMRRANPGVPRMKCQSYGLTEAALTRISTWSSAGVGF